MNTKSSGPAVFWRNLEAADVPDGAVNGEVLTLTEFYARTNKESWRGLFTAFCSGAKAARLGGECNYLVRQDFAAAWKRGFDAMQEYLAAGNKIHIPEAPPKRAYNRRPYGGPRAEDRPTGHPERLAAFAARLAAFAAKLTRKNS